MSGTVKYPVVTVPASAAAKVGATGARRLMGVVIYSASEIGKVEFKNAATDTGTVLLTLQGQDDGASVLYDFTPFGGIPFSTAMFCKPAGTGVIAYVFYD